MLLVKPFFSGARQRGGRGVGEEGSQLLDGCEEQEETGFAGEIMGPAQQVYLVSGLLCLRDPANNNRIMR